MKIKLLELAFNKRQVEFSLLGPGRQIFYNLAKLWIYGKVNPGISDDRRHWRTEVWNKLIDVPKIKKNGYPSADLIMRNTYYKNNDDLSGIIRAAIAQENDEDYGKFQVIEDKDRVNDLSGFDKVCKAYFSWLSEELSKGCKLL